MHLKKILGYRHIVQIFTVVAGPSIHFRDGTATEAKKNAFLKENNFWVSRKIYNSKSGKCIFDILGFLLGRCLRRRVFFANVCSKPTKGILYPRNSNSVTPILPSLHQKIWWAQRHDLGVAPLFQLRLNVIASNCTNQNKAVNTYFYFLSNEKICKNLKNTQTTASGTLVPL